ncbi:repressor LexA [Natranaerovirga pectinivora]|uniref:LexA repressor n=1 Tax=Natranaerovirga pectinivora TaxID=682400 RepID=A0A4R3MQR0_9FIRM|nr:transcriptional repressor LexA [Natranaerovirga pectinivora]TCT14898.1 repressor LexA [Natranaerovirga pectinivora]
MSKGTDKQEKILNFIKQELLNKGYPPSVREICTAVGFKSTSTVHAHLEKLEEKGKIRRDPTKPRAIEIIDESYNPLRQEMASIPIVGRITAGQPILAVENIESYFPIPTEYLPNETTYMLKVEGQSMINAGIFDGDLILVKQQNYAYDRDIVVAMLDDSVTVKRYFKEDNHIRLQPENDSMNPIMAENVLVLGKVIGLFRRF